ncbi:MAG: hypothetical protein WCJ56_15765 [bacterium]
MNKLVLVLMGMLVLGRAGVAMAQAPVIANPLPDEQAPAWMAKATPVTVTGTIGEVTKVDIKKITHTAFTLTTPAETMKVAVAPEKFLTKIGLNLANGAIVTIDGWRINNGRRKEAELVSRTITVGAQTFKLRDADGEALWGEYLEQALVGSPEVTVTGTAKLPVRIKVGKNSTIEHWLHFHVLNGPMIARIYGGPASYAKKIGLNLVDGAPITINGWQLTDRQGYPVVVARQIIVNGVTYDIRNADGEPGWELNAQQTVKPATTQN